MIQLNTPYPATAYLTGFLRLHEERLGLVVAQADPALELFLRLYHPKNLYRFPLHRPTLLMDLRFPDLTGPINQ